MCFLFCAVMQNITLFGSGSAAAFVLLLVAIAVNMIKEVYDDWSRHTRDWYYNSNLIYVLRKSEN